MAMEAFFDDKEVSKFLSEMDKRLKDIENGKKQYLGLLSSIVYRDVLEHFENERGPKGAWDPWSDVYREHMQRIGRAGNKILQFNGRLRQNFMPTNVRKSSQGINWFNNAKTQSGFPYAWGHDEGTGKLPQREFMWASEKALDNMAEQTLQFMIEKGI